MNYNINLIKKKQIGVEKLFIILKTIKIFQYQKLKRQAKFLLN